MSSTTSNVTGTAVQTWVRSEFRKSYCNVHGKQVLPLDMEAFKQKLLARRPGDAADIDGAIIK